jgi:hypothetical protein
MLHQNRLLSGARTNIGGEDAVVRWNRRETYDPLVVYVPKTWLLTQGWQRHGLISFDEVPSRPQLTAA